MVHLRNIPRTATFAWSPGTDSPLIATGTRAGAVDVDFSNETCLELWDLALDNAAQGPELQPTAKINTDSGFNDIAWTQLNDTYPRGIIAGALDNGSLDLWNADKLLRYDSDALISRSSVHTGAIKALQFNPKHSNLVATGGSKGELYVTDLNDVSSPKRLGSTAARADDIDCLDWNKRVSHIMVTGSSGGFVTVWDMKTKKESLTLNNMGRKAVSAVAWDPEKPTRLITAVPLEQDPLILVWDLRNPNAPEKTLRGHDSGVLSLSWCPQDSDLLLSCGKDNRTLCWNPQTGEAYGEFSVVTNWTFETRWNPHNPNLFATASFDGKLAVQTIQSTGNEAAKQQANQNQALDGEDFFAKAQTQPQAGGFSLPKPPKWLQRPVSASFGFGGRVVSVGLAEPQKSRSSKVQITKFEVDSAVGTATDSFEKALQSGDLNEICHAKISEAKTDEEKADWEVIETLISSNPRKQLVDHLGFSDKVDDTVDGVANLEIDMEKESKNTLGIPQVNGSAKGHSRGLSSFFDNNGESDTFLTDLAASKGAKTNNPFKLYTGSESESDRKITRALLLGQFEKALDVCLKEDRTSDAFMIAICGGQSCIEKAQAAYFSKQAGGPNYLRLLASVVGKNLWDVVYNADLENWKEVMATLCTFADEKDFPDLCEALGDRLEEHMKDDGVKEARKDASFCYLAGSKLEKVTSIWLTELQENETAGTQDESDGSAFSIHARGLQNLIEKVTVFRKVTNFKDTELQKTSDWKLETLYSKYIEYADILTSHGQLQVAEKYLDLLPARYPEADVARSRIKQATKKAAPAVVTNQSTAASRSKPLPAVGGYQPSSSTFSPATPQSANPYAPPTSTQPVNPYAPPTASHPANPYAPAAGYQSSQPTQSPYGAPPPRPAIPPPPRAFNQSPSVPPPSQAQNMSNWNDVPESFSKPPISRRGTPAAGSQTVPSPFPGQPPMASQGPPPPIAPPYGTRQRSTPPVAPPPKGPAPPPRVTSPPSAISPHAVSQPVRPPSSATNAYAPPLNISSPPLVPGVMQPPVARGPSPYNAPPAAAPPPSRYAPNPATHAPGPQSRPSIPAPPTASSYLASPPPTNPYAPQPPPQAPAHSPYTPSAAPSQPQRQEPPPPLHSQPEPSSRPSTAQSEQRRAAAKRHPAGDRTHISPQAMPIYEILSSDFARVKARAPSSFTPQVKDTEKRLNILFEHLNNEDLLKPDTVNQMVELAQSLQARNYEQAQAIHLDILTHKTDECGNWMTGVKRLIGMSRATP